MSFDHDAGPQPLYRYVTAAESALAEYDAAIQRHEARAEEHERAGHPDWAMNSRKKADRWRKKRELWTSFGGRFLDPVVDQLQRLIEADVLAGGA